MHAATLACALVLASAPSAPAGPVQDPAQLGWSELVARSDLWPATCSIRRGMEFQGGGRVAAGESLKVVEIGPAEVLVQTADGRLFFGVGPEETDVLDVARRAAAALTPEQRALTWSALLDRPELWPYRVALTRALSFTDVTLPEGRELVLLRAEGPDLVLSTGDAGFLVEPGATDLMQRARSALVAPAPLPGRVLDELRGALVEAASGEPVELDAERPPRFLAFYVSASWCAPCRKFSPKLVEFYRAHAEAHPELEVIFVSEDRSAEEMRGYVEDEGFPWLAVPFEKRREVPLIDSYPRKGIPHLLVLDRHGNVLADTVQGGVYVGADAALAQLEALLARVEREAAAEPGSGE